MKRYIKSGNIPKHSLKFNIIFNVIIPEDTDDLIDTKIAAASYKGFDIPEGPLVPADKDALIDTQILADYHSFVESVEDLLTDYYDLSIYYKNNSEYNSFYFGILAKDVDGNLIADFDFTLRISTHNPSRTKESQSEKKKQKAKLKEVLKFARTEHLRISVTVNDKAFDSWMDAYLKIDADIEHAVKVMTRRRTK